MRLLVFDIDATLILSGGAGSRALTRAFQEVTEVTDGMDGVPFHGMTDYAIIRKMAEKNPDRALSEDDVNEVRRLYGVYLQDELVDSPGYRVMPGVRDLLDILAADGSVLLGLATGNFEETARMKLARGRIDHYFQFGGFGSDSESRPELTGIAIEKGRKLAGAAVADEAVFLVGDTVFDVRCGKEVGARVIAVTTGITSREDLEREKPYAVLPDLTDAGRFLSLLAS